MSLNSQEAGAWPLAESVTLAQQNSLLTLLTPRSTLQPLSCRDLLNYPKDSWGLEPNVDAQISAARTVFTGPITCLDDFLSLTMEKNDGPDDPPPFSPPNGESLSRASEMQQAGSKGWVPPKLAPRGNVSSQRRR